MSSMRSYNDLYAYDLPTCRRIVAHAEAIAAAHREAVVQQRAQRVLGVVQAALDLRDRYWLDQKPTADRQQAAALDAELTGHLATLHAALEAVGESPLHPFAAAARDLRRLLFPQGLKPHAQTRWEDKQVRNDAALALLQAPEQVGIVAALFLGPVVARVAELEAAFDAALHRGVCVTHEQVVAAERAALEHVRHFIHFVLGHFEVDDPTGVRELVLLEVREAEKRIRERHVANLAEGRRKKAREAREGGP